jgi:hypothetical protein
MIELTPEEKRILLLLLEAEKETVRFLAGFGEISEKESMKEEFLSNLINKLKWTKKSQ